MDRRHIGSNFDDFLEEEGILEEVELSALKALIAHELRQAMKDSEISQTEIAQRLGTSRTAVRRLLDPKNCSVTLITLHKLAKILGKELEITFTKKR